MKIKKFNSRIALVLLLIALVSFVLSGCGYAPRGMDGVGNRLSMQYGDKDSKWEDRSVKTLKKQSASPKLPIEEETDLVGFAFHTVPKGSTYGMDTTMGVRFIRSFAITIWQSIFDADYVDTDYYHNGSIQQFSLEPAQLIVKVVDATNDAMDKNSENNTILTNLKDALGSVAAAILVVMWSMNFISDVINERFTFESVLKSFMQLLCGILVILNAEVLVKFFTELGSSLVESANPEGTPFTGYRDWVMGLMDNVWTVSIGMKVSFGLKLCFALGTLWLDFSPLGALIMMVLPLFAQLMCAYKIISAMITRMLELIIRITLAPIPLAFAAHNGFSQDMIRYFRMTLACAMQPVLMLVGCASLNAIGSTVLTIFDFGDNASAVTGIIGCFTMTISYFLLNTFLGETKRLADEIIAR